MTKSEYLKNHKDEIVSIIEDLDIEASDDLIDNIMNAIEKKNYDVSDLKELIIKVSAEKDIDIDNINESISDSTKQYLKEIGEIKLLTREEEISLFKAYNNGDEEAKNRIVEANLRWVVSRAKRHIGKGVPFLDLIQEGNIGLMKAVDKFEIDKGFRFSTYSRWWIDNTIQRAIYNHSRIIRIPVHINERIAELKKVKAILFDELKREPTVKEIAAAMKTETDEIEMLLNLLVPPKSLEQKIGEKEDSEYGDFIIVDEYEVDEDITKQELHKNIAICMDRCLTKKEREIMEKRFGFENGNRKTLDEIGKDLNISRERVRQIEVKALQKLRHPKNTREVKEFLFK